MRGAIALATLAVAAGGCGEKSEPTLTASAPTTTQTSSVTTTTPTQQPPHGQPTKPAETPPGDPRVDQASRDRGGSATDSQLEQQAESTARQYLTALNDHNGATVCRLFAAGALDGFELPKPAGDCAAAVSASIGYRDPHGLPWKRVDLRRLRVAAVSAGSAKVIATVATTFADNREISVEDDVIYLTRAGAHWLIAKPSAELYRAVGAGDIPPSVLAPPGG